MVEKSRIRNLSTRFLGLYRYGFILLLTVFFGFLMYDSGIDSYNGEAIASKLYFPITWGYILFIWIRAHLKVYKVEFDDEYLYVIRRNQDVLIPLENIKDIEMKSLGGMWRVDLFYADVIGDHFYFKPSLLYPLNYQKKDALVNLLWTKIERAKTKNPYLQANALHS
jgi:hypothetical protein